MACPVPLNTGCANDEADPRHPSLARRQMPAAAPDQLTTEADMAGFLQAIVGDHIWRACSLPLPCIGATLCFTRLWSEVAMLPCGTMY